MDTRLRELREQKKLSKKQIAEYLKMTPEGYGYYETGKRSPHIGIINALADYYGVNVDYILRRTDTPDSSVISEYTPIERNLIKKYRRLPRSGKRRVERIIDGEIADMETADEAVKQTNPSVG